MSGVPSASGIIKKRKKNNKYSEKTKKQIAELIKLKPAIWNLADKNHQNVNAVNASWREVAADVDLKVEECKQIWKSLKDSLRYHEKKEGKPSKSGMAAEELNIAGPSVDDSEVIDWEFSECLSFLSDANGNTSRQTLEFFPSSSSSFTDETVDATSAINQASNYSYASKSTPAQSQKEKTTIALTEAIQKAMEAKTERRNKETEWKYKSIYAYLERMLVKLPESVVEDLSHNMVQMVYQKLKEYEDE